MNFFKDYEGKDFGEMKAKEFEDFIVSILSKVGIVERQVAVKNRGDGRKGRVDVVFYFEGKRIGIEIDRKSVRKKSIFKLNELRADETFSILRSPFSITKII